MEQKSLYNDQDFQECLSRIERITPDSKPQWGRMDAAQMMAHCSEILEVTNGKELKNTPFFAKLFKGYIRKMVVNDKPYPKHTKTHPQYRVTSKKDFQSERSRLINELHRFKSMSKEEVHKIRHSLFGKMTEHEKGWSSYKHLDHHLTQFGV